MRMLLTIFLTISLVNLTAPAFAQNLDRDRQERLDKYMKELDREVDERHERYHKGHPEAPCTVRPDSPIRRHGNPDLIYHPSFLEALKEMRKTGATTTTSGPLGDLVKSIGNRVNTDGFPKDFGGIERIPCLEKALGRDFNVIGGASGGGYFFGAGYRFKTK